MNSVDALGLFLALLVYGMVTWRITSLLVAENGPLHIFARLRDVLGVSYDEHSRCVSHNPIAEALCCFKCTSIWIALLVVIAWMYSPDPLIFIARVAALSTIAILIQSRVKT